MEEIEIEGDKEEEKEEEEEERRRGKIMTNVRRNNKKN